MVTTWHRGDIEEVAASCPLRADDSTGRSMWLLLLLIMFHWRRTW